MTRSVDVGTAPRRGSKASFHADPAADARAAMFGTRPCATLPGGQKMPGCYSWVGDDLRWRLALGAIRWRVRGTSSCAVRSMTRCTVAASSEGGRSATLWRDRARQRCRSLPEVRVVAPGF